MARIPLSASWSNPFTIEAGTYIEVDGDARVYISFAEDNWDDNRLTMTSAEPRMSNRTVTARARVRSGRAALVTATGWGVPVSGGGDTGGGDTGGGEEPVLVRVGTLRNPPLSARLGLVTASGYRPFLNQMKLGAAWGGNDSNFNWDQLVADNHITAGGQVNSVPAIGNGISRRMFEGMPAQSGATGRWRLRWQGDATVLVFGSQNENNDVPNEIQFDFTANGENFITLVVESVQNGPIHNFSLVHEDDWVDFDAGGIFREAFLEEVRNYRCLRFDEWVGILTSEDEGGLRITDWASRGLPTDEIFYRFVPYEWMVELCKTVGADMWLCLPTAATDDHVSGVATLVRNSLPEPRHVYAEYTTKTWDFAGTPQAHYVAEQGRIAFGTVDEPTQQEFLNWYGLRSYQVATLWRAVWGSDPRLHTVIQTQCDWLGNENGVLLAPMWQERATPGSPLYNAELGLPTYVAPHTVINCLTVHAQIDGGMAYGARQNEITTWRTTLPQEEVFNNLRDQMLSATFFDVGDLGQRTVVGLADNWDYFRAIADQYDMELACYEIGNHLNGVGGGDENATLMAEFSVSPQMGEVYVATIRALQLQNFDGPIAFSVECRKPDSNTIHGLQRWFGDHNAAWEAVSAVNLEDNGPAGRGVNDFVGTIDLEPVV